MDLPYITEAELIGNLDIPSEDELWALLQENEKKAKARERKINAEQKNCFYTKKKYGQLKLLRRKK